MTNIFSPDQVTDLESLDYMFILNEPTIAKLRLGQTIIIVVGDADNGYEMDGIKHSSLITVIEELYQEHLVQLEDQ